MKIEDNWWFIVILVIFFVYFIMVYNSKPIHISQPLIPIECQQEIINRLKSRKLPYNTTIEITQKNNQWKYRFQWTDGKWYDL